MATFKGKGCVFASKDKGDVLLVTIAGRMFSESNDLSHFQNQISTPQAKQLNIVMDLSGVSYINSRGLKEIISLHRDRVEAGKRLIMVGIRKSLMEILATTKLDLKLNQASSMEDALMILGRP